MAGSGIGPDRGRRWLGQFTGSVPVGAGTTRFSVSAVDASGNATNKEYDVDQTAAGKTFTYDANGNVTSDGTST